MAPILGLQEQSCFILHAEKMHDPDARAAVLQIAQAYVKLVNCIATHPAANVISKRPIE
jgi:hypothetical protein